MMLLDSGLRWNDHRVMAGPTHLRARHGLGVAVLVGSKSAIMRIEELVEYEIVEGLGHKGRSALIDFVARKP